MYRASLLGVGRWLLLAVGHDALWWLVAPRSGMRRERERALEVRVLLEEG
jgi:hypothetical protein